MLNIVLILIVSHARSAGRGRTSGHNGTLTVDERQVAAPVTNNPEAVTLRVVAAATHRAVGAGERANQSMVGEVEAVHRAAVGNTIEVLTVVGQVADLTAAADIELFNKVAVHVVLVSSSINCAAIETGYLEAYNFYLESGTFFNVTDDEEGVQKIILNHATAESLFPKGDAVGKHVIVVSNNVSFGFVICGEFSKA